MAAVEFALLAPIVLSFMFGTFVIGGFLVTRHQVSNAVSTATRLASLAGDPGVIAGLVNTSMDGNPMVVGGSCNVATSVDPGPSPAVSILTVTATCRFTMGIEPNDKVLLSWIPTQVSSTAVMPI